MAGGVFNSEIRATERSSGGQKRRESAASEEPWRRRKSILGEEKILVASGSYRNTAVL
jgi:hypothetical protein